MRLFLLSFFLAAPSFAASSVSIYNEPAGLLFDVLTLVSQKYHSSGISNGVHVGTTQVRLGGKMECTAWGKTAKHPESAAETGLLTCSLDAEDFEVIFPREGGGWLSFNDDTAEVLFNIIPGSGKSRKDGGPSLSPSSHGVVTFKSVGKGPSAGISCHHFLPDYKTYPVRYGCIIHWN